MDHDRRERRSARSLAQTQLFYPAIIHLDVCQLCRSHEFLPVRLQMYFVP